VRRSSRDSIESRVREYYRYVCHGALKSDVNTIASVAAENEGAIPRAGGIARGGFALAIFHIAQDAYLGRRIALRRDTGKNTGRFFLRHGKHCCQATQNQTLFQAIPP